MPTLKITPAQSFTQDFGEECSYTIDITEELGTKTVNTIVYSITNSLGIDATATIGGGSLEASGIITFGVKGATRGKFTLQFIVTCVDLLPDGVTPYEFYITMYVTII